MVGIWFVPCCPRRAAVTSRRRGDRMLTDTPPASANQEAAAKARHRARGGYARIRRHGMLEALAVVVMLAAAAAVRLALAARGWPGVNSDESVMGLMADDVLWHGAHPVFFYGQHYMGALQAYLSVPIFLIVGPTTFALHATTTLQCILLIPAVGAPDAGHWRWADHPGICSQ